MGEFPIEGFHGERSSDEPTDDDHAPEVAGPLLQDQGKRATPRMPQRVL